jgi:hypothetical protein
MSLVSGLMLPSGALQLYFLGVNLVVLMGGYDCGGK